MSAFFDWVIDTLASEDVIDLCFVVSDLVDLPITEGDACESAYFDSLTNASICEQHRESKVPLGKLVL
jgi:hypothetical protein